MYVSAPLLFCLRYTDFTLPDKTSESTTEMTSFELVEPVTNTTTTTLALVRTPTDDTRFEVQQMFARPKLLTRLSFNVGSSTAVQNVPIYAGLVAPPLAAYQDMYAYMRWTEVELRFVTRSQPMQYGLVSFNYVPFMAKDASLTTPLFYDTTSLMNYQPLIIDVTSQEDAVMTVPWHAPSKYVGTNTDAAGVSNGIRLGTLWAICNTSLDSTDSTSLNAVTVDIFASYKGVQFDGPRRDASAAKVARLRAELADTERYMLGQSEAFSELASNLFTQGINYASKKVTDKLADVTMDEVVGTISEFWNSYKSTEPPARETKFEPFNEDAQMGQPTSGKSLSDCRETAPKSFDETRHAFLRLIMRPDRKSVV